MLKTSITFLKKHYGNILFIVVFLLVLFVPSVKATIIQGLLEIGVYNPSINQKQAVENASEQSLANIDLPQVELNKQDLSKVYLPYLKGKVVFINFWATWCPPCLAEMPSLNKLYSVHADNPEVVFLFVDADSDFEKSIAYMNKKKYSLPVYVSQGTFPTTMFNGTLPTTLVFNKEGKLVYKGEGAKNYSSKKFLQFMDSLVAEKPKN